MTKRTGLTRGELWVVGVVVVLAAIVVVMLVAGLGLSLFGRHATHPAAPSAQPAAPAPTPFDEAGLEPDRRAAGLPPCPTGAPAPGPLGNVSVPCLGAPGVARPAGGLAGQDALINLFGSWCQPCRAELPALADYAEQPGAVPVLEVDTRGDRPSAALALLADLGVKLPAVADVDGALADALHAPPALPVSFLLHADGRVTPILPPVPFTSADQVAAAVARARSAG